MTAHFPGLVATPNTQIHARPLSWLDTPNTQTPGKVGGHVFVLGVSSQESGRPCICIRGIKSGKWAVMYLYMRGNKQGKWAVMRPLSWLDTPNTNT
jgi:hypothetical protein